MTWPAAFMSWLGVGLASGLLAAAVLPGRPRLNPGLAAAVGIAGAVAGGLVATVLGFGGLVGFDARALLAASLAAILVLLLFRTATLGLRA